VTRGGLTILNAKPAELSLGAIVSIWGLQESVLSSVRPRNFVLLTIVIFFTFMHNIEVIRIVILSHKSYVVSFI